MSRTLNLKCNISPYSKDLSPPPCCFY
uniref:Uncharacterized protein n=1 Tax=Moniliophthora roreri TaxID=221103 RepID=A0A0W0G6F3_MONRR